LRRFGGEASLVETRVNKCLERNEEPREDVCPGETAEYFDVFGRQLRKHFDRRTELQNGENEQSTEAGIHNKELHCVCQHIGFEAAVINVNQGYNSADNDAGAIWSESSSVSTISNTIFWHNSVAQLVADDASSSFALDHSIIEGGYTGTGNLDVDPLFVDDLAGDYHLQASSPAIDVGDNAALPKDVADLDEDSDVSEQIPFDLDGKSRIVNSIVDMGAYEVQ